MDFKRILQGVLLSFIFIAVIGFFFWGMQWFSGSLETFFQFKMAALSEGAAILDSKPEEQKQIPYKKDGAEDPQLFVESATSIFKKENSPDIILVDKNRDRKTPIASLTKLMTAIVAQENIDLNKTIKISKAAQAQDSRNFLKAGESFIVKDLLHIMLIESNNGAAYAFMEDIGPDKFLELMNKRAVELGMGNTYFSNPTGLGLTNYSTAEDLATLAWHLVKTNDPVLKISILPEFDLKNAKGDFHHKAYNLNDLLKDPEISPQIVLGKTGQTKEAGECLLIVQKAPEQDNGYIINVVLDAQDRFIEMKKIINWTGTNYIWK